MDVMATIPGGVAVRVKVVPGASRTKVAGVLGDRLKVMVAAPPEDGKANRAVCELLAKVLAVAARDVAVSEGHASPRKTIAIGGLTLGDATARLDAALKD